jgi:hypothetical protein
VAWAAKLATVALLVLTNCALAAATAHQSRHAAQALALEMRCAAARLAFDSSNHAGSYAWQERWLQVNNSSSCNNMEMCWLTW